MELPLTPAVLPLQPTNRLMSPQLHKKLLAPQLGKLSSLVALATLLTLISVQGLPVRRKKLSHLVLLQQLAPGNDERLQRHYQELRQMFAELLANYHQLEMELHLKNQDASHFAHHSQQLQQEIDYYKKLIEQLQEKIAQLSSADREDLPQLYQKLLREYKLLQTDFELEKNAKLVLIDQIEFLAKENEMLQLDLPQGDGNMADDDLLDEEEEESLVEYQPNFQFPPTPDVDLTHKRGLIPIGNEEFVLLPLKLADVAQKRLSCLDESQSAKPRKLWRQLVSHHRYSSHDLFPIQVEFEQPPCPVANPRDSAFDTLNGDVDPVPITPAPLEALLKRLSLEEVEMLKQEMMKLKFELQLLRLQNEKLLSYIGYEMHRLHRKREKTPEYLDQKLIERLREELIRKKRVLRLVLINPLQKALGGPAYDDDAYGFMAYNGDLSKRVFSNGLQAYYHLDEVDGDEEEEDSPTIKKHKLMVFSGMVSMRGQDDDLGLEYEEDDEAITGDEQHEETNHSMAVVPAHGVFSSFKYLMLGSHGLRRKQDELVDDGLKYKFLTIAMAITVIGLQLSHARHH